MSERQKEWLPGAGRGGGWEVTVYWVDSFSFTRWKWVTEMDVGDDCVSVNLFNAHWIFKSGKDGKFCYMYFIKI